MNKLLLTILVLLCCSCQKTFLAVNGIKKPSYETAESVNHKLSRYHPEYVKINAIPRDTASLIFLLKTMKGLPSSMIFNRSGYNVDQMDTGYCAGRALKFAMKLGTGQEESLDPGIRIEDVYQRIISTGESIDTSYSEYHYTVVIFWAKFMGRSNLNVFQLMEELKKRKEMNMNFLLVNVDVQRSWNVDWIPYRF